MRVCVVGREGECVCGWGVEGEGVCGRERG